MAHEINNPLAGIKNSFRLIKDAVPADHPDRDMVGRIEREIDRIARIVRQMYQIYSPRVEELHRYSRGRNRPRRGGDCSNRSAGSMRSRSKSEAIPPELTVRAYEGSLQQILFNLVANAIQASPPAGSRARGRRPGRQRPCHGSVSAIRDRESPSRSRPGCSSRSVSTDAGGTAKHGLGLGLAIVKNIVESLQGRITFESTLGEGTCFHVDLPAM